MSDCRNDADKDDSIHSNDKDFVVMSISCSRNVKLSNLPFAPHNARLLNKKE